MTYLVVAPSLRWFRVTMETLIMPDDRVTKRDNRYEVNADTYEYIQDPVYLRGRRGVKVLFWGVLPKNYDEWKILSKIAEMK